MPVTSHIKETMITPANKMLRKSPNSLSFSRIRKNEGWSNKKIERPIASGVRAMAERERERAIDSVSFVF